MIQKTKIMFERESTFQIGLHQALEYFLIYSVIDAPLRPITKQPYLSMNPLEQLAQSLPKNIHQLIDTDLPNKNEASPNEYAQYLSAVYRMWEQVVSQAGGKRQNLPVGKDYKNWLENGGKRIYYRPVHILHRLMKKWGYKYFIRGVIHGSVGTLDDEPGFSDLDLAFVVRRGVLTNPYHLFNLRRLSARIIAYSFAFDPYMHHGPLYFSEIDLLRYHEPFFPVLLFDYGVNIIPNVLNISVWSHFTSELSIRILDSVNQQFTHCESIGISNLDRFELQWLLAGVMMLPVLYNQLNSGEFRYKREVFDLVRPDFDSAIWEPVEIASILRKELPLKNKMPIALADLLGRLCKPGYIQRWSRRRGLAQVSKKIQNILEPDYIEKAQELFHDICKKIEIIPDKNSIATNNPANKISSPALPHSSAHFKQLDDLGNGPFCQIPRRIELEEYDRCTQYLIDCWGSLSPQPISIYKIGSVNTPGISDLDFIIVFENGAIDAWAKLQEIYLPKWMDNLLVHSPFICDRNSWGYLQTWLPVFNLQLLWGEELKIPMIPKSCVEGCALGTAIDYLMLKVPRDFLISASQKPLRLKDHLCVLHSIKHTLRLIDIAGIEITEEMKSSASAIAKLRERWFDSGWERFDDLKRFFIQAVISSGEAILSVDRMLMNTNIKEWLDINRERLTGKNPDGTHFNFISNWSLQTALREFESNNFKEEYWINPLSFVAVLSFYTSQLPGLSVYIGFPTSWDGDQWAKGLSYRAKGLRVYAESTIDLGIPSIRHIAWNLSPSSLLRLGGTHYLDMIKKV